jgi:hypothetical protein
MTMNIEEEYLDVLQNIEFAIVSVYQQHPELVDFEVEQALSALIRAYGLEQQQRTPGPAALKPLEQEVYDRVRAMCEWRLGRTELGGVETPRGHSAPAALSLEEVIACLKRIRKSVQKWNRRGGRQGYLQFVSGFVG